MPIEFQCIALVPVLGIYIADTRFCVVCSIDVVSLFVYGTLTNATGREAQAGEALTYLLTYLPLD